METSWAEQRDYVRNAAKAIGEDKAKEALLGFDMAFPCACGMTKLENPTEPISIGDYNVSVDYNGSISSLSHKGKTLADKEHSFFSFVYNAYSQNEYNNWYDTYVTNHVDWAMEDFGKYGVDKANDCLKTVPAKLENVYKSDNELLVYMSVDKDICDKFGAPRSLALKLTFKENKIAAEFFWKDKDASRVPEALWLNIKPFGEAKAVRKLGEWIDVTDVIDNGNKRMHSTDCGVKYGDVTIKSLDANVVNIGEPTPLIFSNEPVKTDDGVYFNLVNNVWGTNFVMWYSDGSFVQI